jgi:hypothetical protein
MNTDDTAPRRVEWSGPESWTVWTDEDGTHIRSARGDSLEMPDVERLFSLWNRARSLADANHIPAPKPPTREEMRNWSTGRAEEYAKRRVLRAVEAEFATSTTPF